jgi:putative transcriptional regulator
MYSNFIKQKTVVMDMLDLQKRTGIKPAIGKILIAEPFLIDSGFARSVVLLCEHGPQGTIGFILNRASELQLPDLLPEFKHFDFNIYDGGPVQKDTLHVLHTLPEQLGGHEILPGLYWGGSYTELNKLMENNLCNASNVKLFQGYSGWDESQLEKEIEDGTWLVAHGNAHLVFDDGLKNVWHKSILSLGDEFAFMANLPLHPQLN